MRPLAVESMNTCDLCWTVSGEGRGGTGGGFGTGSYADNRVTHPPASPAQVSTVTDAPRRTYQTTVCTTHRRVNVLTLMKSNGCAPTCTRDNKPILPQPSLTPKLQLRHTPKKHPIFAGAPAKTPPFFQ